MKNYHSTDRTHILYMFIKKEINKETNPMLILFTQNPEVQIKSTKHL
jgi:hypothetical protein